MISFAKTILGLGLIAALLGSTPAEGGADQALSEQVSARIAELWAVSPACLELEWGRSNDELDDLRAESVRLLGRGSDGFFTVMIQRADGRSSSVRVRAGLHDSVWVATRPLETGHRIVPGDLRAESRLRWGAPAPDRGLSPRAGWEVRRPVASGEEVGWPTLVEPPLVRAGDPIRLTWNRGGVTVSMEGVALNDAREGEPVRVRVEDRIGPLHGTVTDRGNAVLQKGEDSCNGSS